MDSKRTINGKPFKDALERLVEPFEESAFRNREVAEGTFYRFIPYESFFRRINKVIGVSNYTFCTSDGKLAEIGGQYHYMVHGELTIISDDGTVICKRGCDGSADVIMAKASGKATNLNNSVEIANQNAFIHCMKALSVGTTQLWDLKKGEKPTRQNNATAYVSDAPQTSLYGIHFKQKITAMSKGYKSVVSVDELEDDRELIIWQDGIASIEHTMSMADFVSRVKPGTSFHIEGYEKTFRTKKQLVMVSVSPEGDM